MLQLRQYLRCAGRPKEMPLYLKSEAEIERMRASDQIVASVLKTVRDHARPGVSTL